MVAGRKVKDPGKWAGTVGQGGPCLLEAFINFEPPTASELRHSQAQAWDAVLGKRVDPNYEWDTLALVAY